MIKSLKWWLDSRKKQRMLNYIDKACDECFELKRKLKVQERFVNILLEGYKEVYGEDLRKLLDITKLEHSSLCETDTYKVGD